MMPAELLAAVTEIAERWPSAVVYRPDRTTDIRISAGAILAVDEDRVWPHECQPDESGECNWCFGEYRLVAWVDKCGQVHCVEPATLGGEAR